MDKIILANTLLQLKSEILSIQSSVSETTIQTLMQKFDMLFLGGKFNTIYSSDLCHMFKAKQNLDVSLDELNRLIPDVCSSLKMKIESQVRLEDFGKPNPPIGCYVITLF